MTPSAIDALREERSDEAERWGGAPSWLRQAGRGRVSAPGDTVE